MRSGFYRFNHNIPLLIVFLKNMKIAFKNLRSLIDTGDISIKPMTVLLGQNSSGKSTFLRTFPLLKQSIEARTTGPILWYGRFVDFGDFSNSLNDNAEDKFIEYSFDLDISNTRSTRFSQRVRNPIFEQVDNIQNCKISIQLRADKENKTYTSQMTLSFSDFLIVLKIGKTGVLEDLSVDGYSLKQGDLKMVNIGNGFLPKMIFIAKDNESHFTMSPDRFIVRKIFEKVREISKKKFTDGTILKIINKLDFTDNSSLYASIVKFQPVKGFENKIKNWKIDDPNYSNFKYHLISSIIPHLLSKCDNQIVNIAENTSYIAPLRATAERYYRPQDLNVDEVDFQGKNLALVLRNFSTNERQEFEKWCTETFHFYPRAKMAGGNITITVKFEQSNVEHNIADLGFGFSQILPFITQIWTGSIKGNSFRYRSSNKKVKIYAIEQPELHLHPKIQALIVDALIGVINYTRENDMQVYFILETHSETIVNAIGTRIFKNKMSKEDVNVVMFERLQSSSKTKLIEVKYDDQGTLTNWPYGFFEESWQS